MNTGGIEASMSTSGVTVERKSSREGNEGGEEGLERNTDGVIDTRGMDDTRGEGEGNGRVENCLIKS